MIKSVLKGVLIGLANILPGVSGGTLAVSMGIYDRLIHCINHLFRDFKENVLFMLPIVLGMGIAIVGSAFGLDYLFEAYPLPTNFLFIGLILGSLPPIYGKVKDKSIHMGHVISAVLFFAFIIVLAFFKDYQGTEVVLSTNLFDMGKMFLMGIIGSATMVVPGVSGSMILLMLGYYNPILEEIQAFVVAVLKFDLQSIIYEILVLVPFGIGLVLGIFILARLIEIVFEKYPSYAYWAIVGLILASPVGILAVANITKITVWSVIASCITFAGGLFIATKLGDD